jgi:phenylacetic acid degradation operon negative regulatory protein
MGGSLQLTLSLLAVGSEMAEATATWILARSTRSGNLQRKFARLTATGAIIVSREGPVDQRILRLTGEARCRLLGGVDPEVEWRRCWDGVWRLVTFDIPETSLALRNQLRRRLRGFRFGWLQNSVWISAHPIDAFQQSVGEMALNPESLVYFEARPAGGESHAALVNGAWDFRVIFKNYAVYREVLRLRPDQITGTAAGWFRWLAVEHRAWGRIARSDPFLPLELQPPGYPGQAVWAERREALQAFARALGSRARKKSRIAPR